MPSLHGSKGAAIPILPSPCRRLVPRLRRIYNTPTLHTIPRGLSTRTTVFNPANLLLSSQSQHQPSHTPNPTQRTRTLASTSARNFAAPIATAHTTSPTPLTPNEYHTLSDAYIDTLVSQLEALQEEREDVDVEYSAGVLTLHFPPAGTYVLNKQPPNKQIWLSSPVSGPKRYDWVASQEEGREGEWVYLRDGSTLSGLLEEEVGVQVGEWMEAEE